MSASLCGCGKKGSQDATQESGASASQASSQPGQASSDAAASRGQAQGAVASVGQKRLQGEGVETPWLIKAGGPYPFSEDGVLFRYSAALLPQHPRGYDHVCTVRAPGSTDRRQCRIACGGPRRQTGDGYCTDDYYVSFKRIAE